MISLEAIIGIAALFLSAVTGTVGLFMGYMTFRAMHAERALNPPFQALQNHHNHRHEYTYRVPPSQSGQYVVGKTLTLDSAKC
ncbi:hypothetical protein DL98DRAFT_522929 [Cadophora sp. DSE1049]|nr:hypothetical protein DL98DRAFT_522929 [Cadophora sp. DSE1049]